ncbi:hypothetical protein C1645_827748 [Glomus cerebriforme]|uniref:Uncharacterized protein n=1 Tax=Glomus cerebriforme TaxID=658196 RepID=A0A397SMN1_9GLOM|nr:hypothetical protein C1645_827748 [Glomus cerebriforme]
MAQEEKKQNLEERIEIAEMRSKLSDAKQHVPMKKLVYKQDNSVHENFRNATIKPPLTPRSCKRSEYEDDKNNESSDEDDVINFDRVFFDTYTKMSKTKGDRWTLKSGEKKFEGVIKVEKLYSEYKYWEEGKKQDFTEIEFILKVFSCCRKETVFKSILAGRKIDLQIITQEGNIELSHSKCARYAIRVKVIKDRSKCLRTNKCVLDQYLKNDFSENMVKNSAILGLQLAAFYGQVIGIDLLDEGLYFGFEGPSFRFPAQLNDIAILQQALEILYYFKDSIIHKADALSCLNNNGSNPIYKTLHTESISRPHHRKYSFIRSTYFTLKGQLKNEMRFVPKGLLHNETA